MRLPHPVASAPVSLALHGDIFDPWCWIAERRLALLVDGFHGKYSPVSYVPWMARIDFRPASEAERRRRARDAKRAAGAPDAPPLSPELWSGQIVGPQYALPALIAWNAARLQGDAKAEALRRALREAALLSGIDASRRDVILEIASRVGLDLARFVPALDAPATERALRCDLSESHELGITSAPALVIGEDWLVSGLRPLCDYRRLLKRYLSVRVGAAPEHTVH